MTLPPNGDPSALEFGWDIISNIFASAAEFDAIDQADMSDELMETMRYGTDTEAGHMPHGIYDEPVVLPDQPTQSPETSRPANSPEGWVFGGFVEMHPSGEQDENGRINPELDQLGYRWVEAKDGDSIRLIANRHSVDVAETVMLNMDHMLRPDLMYPGDRVYLPS
jgi:hypothetical protein